MNTTKILLNNLLRNFFLITGIKYVYGKSVIDSRAKTAYTLFLSPLQELEAASTVWSSILSSIIGSGLAFLDIQSIVSTPVWRSRVSRLFSPLKLLLPNDITVSVGFSAE